MASIWDIIKTEGSKYIRDAMPGGLLNPEVPKDMPTEVAKGLLGFTPVVGDAISGYDAVQAARKGNYGEAALNGIGVLPFVPALGGMVKGAKYSAKEALEKAKELSLDAKRVVNPETWDDSLGGAAWFDRRTPGVYHAIHMTDDPSKAGKSIKRGESVVDTYGIGDPMAQMNSEIGKGLYVSAREDMWKHRGGKAIPVSMKGDFLELDRVPYHNSDALRDLGFDGAFVRGGMGAVPQMVIWNNDAIKSFGKFSR